MAAGRAAAQQAHALHNNLLSCWARHVPLLRCACHAMHTCPPPPNRAPSMLRMHCMCCKHACQPSQIHPSIAQLTTPVLSHSHLTRVLCPTPSSSFAVHHCRAQQCCPERAVPSQDAAGTSPAPSNCCPSLRACMPAAPPFLPPLCVSPAQLHAPITNPLLPCPPSALCSASMARGPRAVTQSASSARSKRCVALVAWSAARTSQPASPCPARVHRRFRAATVCCQTEPRACPRSTSHIHRQ